MAVIDNLFRELDETYIAKEVARAHDSARMRYALSSNTVRTWDEYAEVVADYTSYHHRCCVAEGGTLGGTDAVGRYGSKLPPG